METVDLFFTEFKAPVGEICLVGSNDELYSIFWPKKTKKLKIVGEKFKSEILEQAIKQLQLYFAGKLKEFSLSVKLNGSSFQKKILTALAKVPFGNTLSYKDLAKKAGLPASYSRAVGAVMRSNPLPLVYPCHRIIGSDNSLTGFGGGLDVKHYLLNLERQVQSNNFTR